MAIDVQALAETIFAAYAKGERLNTLPSRDAGLDIPTAFAVESELVRMRKADGRSVAGRKVGFANKAMWRILKLDSLVWAHMYDDTVRYSDHNEAELSLESLAGRIAPRIEPEIVFKMKAPLAGGTDPVAVLEAVEWIALGFEIIDCVYPNWEFQPADFVAAYGLHVGLVVGEPQRIEPGMASVFAEQLPNFKLRLLKNGELVDEGSGKNSLKSPALCLGELSRIAPLETGELVSSGTLTGAQPIAVGDTWSAEVEGLDLPKLTLRINPSPNGRGIFLLS